MATAWSTLEDEIQAWLGSSSEFNDTGSMYAYLRKWGNRAVRTIHQEIDMFYKLQTSPQSIVYTNSDYYKALPTGFFKKSKRFTYVKYNDTVIDMIPLEELNALDPNHDDTTANAFPDYVALESKNLFVYPMFAGTIEIEGYFTAPTDMTSGTSNPDVTDSDDALAQETIMAFVLNKAFVKLQDLDMATYFGNEWTRNLELYKLHVKRSDSEKTNEMVYY